MRNKEIRETIANSGVRYWRLAEAIGINSSTLTVWLRQELSGERLSRVKAALEKLSKEKEAARA